jgi:hypothetical protein
MSNTNIIHNENRNRFEIHLEDDIAVLNYQRSNNTIIYTYAGVPPAFRGRGIASKLAKAGMEYAKEQGFTVEARCSFVAAYVRRHPEYHGITRGYDKE